MPSTASGATPVRYCTKCGNPLQSGARFCTACGAAVSSAEPQQTPTSSADAERLFEEALVMALAEDTGIPTIPLLQKALAIGLAPKDEVPARLMLGEAYREIFGNSGLPGQKMLESNEFRQCMVEIEKAFELDRSESVGYFSQPLNIGRLQHLDAMYVLASRARQRQDGTEAAIAYLKEKLRAVDYISRPPLLESLVELGNLYARSGALQDAAQCLRRVLETEPLYPTDEERNSQLREMARQNLTEIQGHTPESFGGSSAPAAGYCTGCRKPLLPGARFCTTCGAPVDASQR